jgi:2'-5' RNA ligase
MADLKPPLSGYALWLEAHDEEQRKLQGVADELAQQHHTRSFGAHATLLALLDKTEADVDRIREVARTLAAQGRGLETEIIGIGMRQQYFQAVFLVAAPSADLMALHQQARTLLGHENDPPFMPHWSALYGDLDQATKTAIAQNLFSELTFPWRVPLRTIALVSAKGYPDGWKVIERFPFNS